MNSSFNEDEFWSLSHTPSSSEISVFAERKSLEKSTNSYLGNVGKLANKNSAYSDLLKKRRLSSLDSENLETDIIISSVANIKGSELTSEEQEMVESLSTQLKDQQKSKALEMYYNLYMGATNSDMEYRLGKITSSLLEAGESNGNSIIHDESGRAGLYTRSDFSRTLSIPYFFYGKKENFSDKYTALGFPPFKLSDKIFDKTDFDVEGKDFDLNNFVLYKDNLVYRDVGFKQLNDNIMYLQWLLEGVSGIVSTYMTEWDLSVYMQEGFITKNANNSIMKMYLNYRIYDDNPYADEKFGYTNSKALCFNTVGSAVSVLESDNRKVFRPSDFPYSKWWLPYIKDHDFKVSTFETTYGDSTLKIPYMSIYDDVNSQFSYGTQNVKSIIKHQDALNMVLSCKQSPTLRYYELFYNTPEDGLTSFDLTVKNYLKKIAGADFGSATSIGKDLKALISEAKTEMLADGGLFGSLPIGNTSSGFYNRDELKSAISQVSTGDVSSNEVGTLNASTFPTTSSTQYCVQSKMTGVNIFSPFLYGGPHGRECSPKSLQFYFDEDSILNEGMPAIDAKNTHKNFTSVVESDYFSGSESKYKNENLNNMSPSFAIKTLLHGLTSPFEKTAIVQADDWYEQEGNYILNDFGEWVPYFKDTTETRGEVYEKEKIFRYSSLEETEYNWQEYGWLSYYNPAHSRTTETIDGTTYYVLKARIPCIETKSTKSVLKNFEFVNTHASSNAAWTISLKKVTNIYQKTPSEYIYDLKTTETSEYILDKEWGENSPQYILEFNDENDRDEFIEEVILLPGAEQSTAKVFFFESKNVKARFEKGPDSIFSAKVYLRYEFDKNKEEYSPLIFVDFSKCDFFETNLTEKPFDNANLGEMNIPLHLCSFTAARVKAASPQELFSLSSTPTISGFGYTTFFPGLVPNTTSYKNEFGITYDAINALQREGSLDDKLKDLPLNLSKIVPYIEFSKQSGKITYIKSTLEPRRKSFYADEGLRKSFLNLCTRAKFYKAENGVKIPMYISIKTPLRNFVSCAQNSLPYIREFKDLFESSLSFDSIRELLCSCVDKCILKASGYDENDPTCQPDKDHPLYNYWINQAIEIFINKKISEESFLSNLNEQTDLIEKASSSVNELLAKDIEDCTVNEIKNAFSIISAIYSVIEDETTTKVFLSYLNVLYAYRLYFVGCRFNKEDGTMYQMRALEKVLDFIAPSETVEKPDSSEVQEKEEKYSVTFFEIQNRINDKLNTYVDDDATALGADCLSKLYVKVRWATENDYIKYNAYLQGQGEKVDEVVKIIHNDVEKYAFKPLDGTYQLYSKEYNENLKNVYYNKMHPNDTPRVVEDTDPILLDIAWQNSENMTPIKFDVFGSVNVDGLLEYSKLSVSPSDLICLIEEGADFWTITVPESLKAYHSLYKSCLTLKRKDSQKEISIKTKKTAIAGPFTYGLSPIIKSEGVPSPSLSNFDISIFK